MGFASKSTEDAPKSVICTSCFTMNYVTPISLQVTKGEKYERSSGVIIGRSGSQPWVSCPTCGTTLKCLLNNGHSRFAFCTKDRQIVEVTHLEFEQWRETALATT